ncbi:MAG: hypothetical protein H7247_09980, partial [Polaromonas sp.]|nr:hypothetical protein [Gemmatimonadaceae bacterium]
MQRYECAESLHWRPRVGADGCGEVACHCIAAGHGTGTSTRDGTELTTAAVDPQKLAVARAAIAELPERGIIGLGTGSTAKLFI